jgi:hypothetical protein
MAHSGSEEDYSDEKPSVRAHRVYAVEKVDIRVVVGRWRLDARFVGRRAVVALVAIAVLIIAVVSLVAGGRP